MTKNWIASHQSLGFLAPHGPRRTFRCPTGTEPTASGETHADENAENDHAERMLIRRP